jgi:hypothetical protein
MRRHLVLLTALGLAVSGCGHSSAPDEVASADAQVAGALMVVGGPPGVGPMHWPGTIRVQGPVDTTLQTDSHGYFSAHLPPGRYRFSGTSPKLDDGRDVCTSRHPVVLTSHRTVHVSVICDIP